MLIVCVHHIPDTYHIPDTFEQPIFQSYLNKSIILAFVISPHTFFMGGNFVYFSMNRNLRIHGLIFVIAYFW